MKKINEEKSELLQIEQLSKIKSNPAVKATILSVLKMIPLIGELIDSSIDDLLSEYQIQKRNELINIILSDGEKITSEMVNDVEFIYNFARTLETVNRLATNDKVKYFANLIKNGYFTSCRISNDEFEEYSRLLTELSFRQIKYLCIYNECKKKTEVEGSKLTQARAIQNEFKNQVNLSENELLQVLNSVQRTSFMKDVIGSYYGYTGGVYYLDDEFDRFEKWIASSDYKKLEKIEFS